MILAIAERRPRNSTVIICITLLVFSALAATFYWNDYNYYNNYTPAQLVSNAGSGTLAIISYDHKTGSYSIQLLNAPERSYVESSPVPLDDFIDKTVHIKGKTVLTHVVLHTKGYTGIKWPHPVAAVAISEIKPVH